MCRLLNQCRRRLLVVCGWLGVKDSSHPGALSLSVSLSSCLSLSPLLERNRFALLTGFLWSVRQVVHPERAVLEPVRLREGAGREAPPAADSVRLPSVHARPRLPEAVSLGRCPR